MDKAQPIITLALKAVALAMAVASVVLSILGATPAGTNVLLLGSYRSETDAEDFERLKSGEYNV